MGASSIPIWRSLAHTFWLILAMTYAMTVAVRGRGHKRAMRQHTVLFFDSHSGFFDGAQQSLYLLLKHLDRSQFRPIFVGPEEGLLTQRLTKLGVQVVILTHDARLGRYGGRILQESLWVKSRLILPYLAYAWRITRIIREAGVEICHCNSTRSVLTVGPAARMAGIPLVWHHRLNVGGWNRMGLKLADRVILVADSLRENFPAGPAADKKFVTVYNGVNLKELTPTEDSSEMRQELGIKPEWQAVGMTGFLTPRKGQLDLLRAASSVIRVRPRTTFVLVGEAKGSEAQTYADRLRAYVAAEGLDGHVIFAGWRADVARVLQGLDLFVLPSLNEGLPRAILEAMALSLPVVATRVGGNAELVVHGQTGLLVPAQDPNALAEAMLQILQNPGFASALGQRGRERIEARFSLEAAVRGVEEVFDAVLAGRRRTREARGV